MQRPAGVTILAVLNYFVGAWLVLWFMFNPLLGVLGALLIGLGYGLWKLRNWARQIQIVLNMTGAVGCLLLTISEYRNNHESRLLFFGPGFTVLNVVIILYMLWPYVKQAFGARSHSGGGPEVQKAREP